MISVTFDIDFLIVEVVVKKIFSKLEIWASSFYFLSKFFLPVLFLFLCAVFLSSRLLPERGQGGAGGAGDVTDWTFSRGVNALDGKLAWLGLATYAHHPCSIIITIAPLCTCLLLKIKGTISKVSSIVAHWGIFTGV